MTLHDDDDRCGPCGNTGERIEKVGDRWVWTGEPCPDCCSAGEVLHDPDCPMTNSDPETRTICTCDGSQWYAEDGSHRTVPEGGGDKDEA